MPTQTRKDISRNVAKELSLKLRDADHLVETVLSTIRDMLMNAEPEIRLEVRDFGAFEVKVTKAKPGARNPRTGELVYVPPRRKVMFRPGKKLRGFLLSPLNPEEEAFVIEREHVQYVEEPVFSPVMEEVSDD
ncbi:MAG: integration host factor subunit beta [Bacteroidetes bacterium]|nr:integration host factor subunit beta [Bacteroidota bacterium]